QYPQLHRPPRSVLVCDSSTFLHEKNRVTTQVEQLHFNYKVSLLLPECSSAPSHLDGVLNGFSSFYLIRNLPIYELLDRDFLQSAVFQGSVYGLSYRTRIDEDNCVALMPDGHLVLSLDKDSFEVLGVEGKPSRFNHRTKSRFVVSVDLCDGSMAPGGRGYQRLHTGLRSRLQMKADFLLSHHPGRGGASLQALLSRYDWSEHRPAVSSRTLTDLSCPTLLTSDLQPRDSHSVLEWLGAVDAAINAVTQLPVLACLSRAEDGVFSGAPSHLCLPVRRRHLEQPRLASWASLTVHGFADSPVCWGRDEHGALKVGENFYSLLMFQDHSYQLYLAAGAHDSCPP
uniref:Ribonuclease P/MRP 40 subunit n=1 Tax=Takifugu rubripes TaxID=31033 RepID=A0A674P9J7_TAKRU